MTNWELSGNGFGQRTREDQDFGHFNPAQLDLEDGDNRASFLRESLGHRPHHLIFWELSDEQGILAAVMTVLGPEVAADGEKAASDNADVRRRRRDPAAEEEDRQERRIFRREIGAGFNVISLTSLRENLREEEKTLLQYRLALLTATPQECELYQPLVEHHSDRIQLYEAEIAQLASSMVGLRPRQSNSSN